MSSSLLCLGSLLIFAISLDYFLILRWKKYRDLYKEKEKEGASINNLVLISEAFLGAKTKRVVLSALTSVKIILKTPIPYVFLFLLLGIVQFRHQLWPTGTICIGLGLTILALNPQAFDKNISTLEKNDLGLQPTHTYNFTNDSLKLSRPTAFLWAATTFLLVISIYLIRRDVKTMATDYIAATAWIVSMILSMMVMMKGSIDSHKFLAKIKKHRNELTALLIIIALAIAVRIYDLPQHPYPWSGDEMSIGTQTRQILHGKITNLFDVGWALQPNWSFLPTAFSISLFGENITAIRLVSVIAGTLAVLFTYLTARELFNPPIALIAGVFLATLPYNMHFSRIGVDNIMDSLMSALVFWFIAKIIKRNDTRLYYLTGAIGGLCLYTYAGTRLVPILGAAFLLIFVAQQKEHQVAYWKNFFTFTWALIISAGPEVAFLTQNPNNLMGRMKDEGIFFNGWLIQQIEQTGKGPTTILLGKLADTSLAFIASPATGMFYNSPKPYLNILGSVFFLVGMLYCLIHLPKMRTFIILTWFWAVVLLGGVLTRPPAHTRLLMASPATAIMVALGIYIVVKYLQELKVISRRLEMPVLILITCTIVVQQLYFYMVEYRNNFYFQDANGEFAMESGIMAKKLGDGFQIFILGNPRLDSNFPTLAFLVPDNRRADLNTETYAVFSLPPGQKAAFFATPENHNLLKAIMAKYPSGNYSTFYRITNPWEILFEYYILGINN